MRPVVTYWPGKVHCVVGIAGDPMILVLDGWTPFSVERRVSLCSGELRSAHLGSSEWGILWWITRYVLPDVLLTASWRLRGRPTYPHE